MNNKIILGVVALVVIVGGVYLYKNKSSDTSGDVTVTPPAVVDANPKPGEIAAIGTIDCLPLQSGKTPTADQCILGLKGDDGKIYALVTSAVEEAEKGIGPNTKVRAIGTYAPADTTSEEAKIYKYDGVLNVRVLQNNS